MTSAADQGRGLRSTTWPRASRALIDLVGQLRLDAQAVRIPLMVEARGRAGGLGIHLPIDDVQDRQQRRRDDPRPTRTPGHHEELAVPVENRRRHARKRPLAGRDEIGAARVDQPVAVGRVLRDGEIVHLVIQDDARPRHRDPRAERRIDRHRERHRPPCESVTERWVVPASSGTRPGARISVAVSGLIRARWASA